MPTAMIKPCQASPMDSSPQRTRPLPLAGSAERVAAIDWPGLSRDLDDRGNAVIEGLLSASECREVAGWYANDALFRSRVVMASHGFGRGEYKYFSYPLPPLVATLSTAACPVSLPLPRGRPDTTDATAPAIRPR